MSVRTGPFGEGTSSSLARDLARAVRGAVRFDDGSRALYATDASNYRRVPIGVVLPESIEDVLAAIDVCRRHGAPVLTRGGGTSLAGQCCNTAVVLDFSRHLRRVLEVDPDRRLARVEPGVVLDDLQRAAAPYGLTFGPDPASHAQCTLGGMIGNDSCGVHSVMARFQGNGAKTSDHVSSLDVATYDGLRLRVGRTDEAELARIREAGGRTARVYADLERLRDEHAGRIREKFPKIPRRVSGYNLPALLPENGFHVARALVGSEGTCVTVLQATLHLIPNPPARALLVAGFPDVFAAADAVPGILEHRPSALEGFDESLVADMRRSSLHPNEIALLPPGGGWLLIELAGATADEAQARARRLGDALARMQPAPSVRLATDPREIRRFWQVRESSLPATAHARGRPLTWEGWEDSAVAPERLGPYLRDQRRLWEKHGYRGDLYGHFGDGCVHTRLDFDLVTAEGIGRFRAYVAEAAELVLSYGGSLSGEHGDGQARSELLPRMFGPELMQAFRDFKRIWDPDARMNPGRIVDPLPIVQDLRLANAAPPSAPRTTFRFPEDDGDLGRVALRCVGVARCRTLEGGSMCPSYRATEEEAHSTRGRARLLFEMLRGDTIGDGWKSEEVRDALDLCLACKACKTECPAAVDMATYKAEFLSHYYEGRRRPRTAYLFGRIHRWARLVSKFPGAANFFTQTPGLSHFARAAAGIDPRRPIPRLASRTFRSWFRGRDPARTGNPPVLLWVDTFTDFFRPEIGRSAVEVLEAAGFRVEIPAGDLCCGRPLYDFGMLAEAQHLLRGALASLREPLRAGRRVVVLEPSCAAVFRDEAVNLFPDDEDALRLAAQTRLLGEFLATEGPGLTASGAPPRRAVVLTHCHQQALFGRAGDELLLGRIGLEARFLDAGCCGMAGAFGFERGEHYEVSRRCAERILAPAVRQSPPGTLILADGFSCREQIFHMTGRAAIHLAQAVRGRIESAAQSGRAPERPLRPGEQRLRPGAP